MTFATRSNVYLFLGRRSPLRVIFLEPLDRMIRFRRVRLRFFSIFLSFFFSVDRRGTNSVKWMFERFVDYFLVQFERSSVIYSICSCRQAIRVLFLSNVNVENVFDWFLYRTLVSQWSDPSAEICFLSQSFKTNSWIPHKTQHRKKFFLFWFCRFFFFLLFDHRCFLVDMSSVPTRDQLTSSVICQKRSLFSLRFLQKKISFLE